VENGFVSWIHKRRFGKEILAININSQVEIFKVVTCALLSGSIILVACNIAIILGL